VAGPALDAPGAKVTAAWKRLSPLPGGRWLFSVMVGRTAPYTGTIGARVEQFGDGHCVVSLRDRRAVRNHLNSVHAVALVNLAEMVSGLAMMSALPAGVRGIVVGLSIDYLKKARGTLMAETRTTVPPVTTPTDHELVASIRDTDGIEVARARIQWRLAPPRVEGAA
jgi:acyl-coenzyme A thioesterase PaaI-like protein